MTTVVSGGSSSRSILFKFWGRNENCHSCIVCTEFGKGVVYTVGSGFNVDGLEAVEVYY